MKKLIIKKRNEIFFIVINPFAMFSIFITYKV
jgi:hypothetical protein